MPGRCRLRFYSAGGCLLVLVTVLGMAAQAHGQAEQPTQRIVILGPAYGGTPLSYEIQAQAQYMEAFGDMVKSVAEARKINAEAVAKELENWVKYVEDYYKRRATHDAERAKNDPNYLERETKRQKVLARRVEEQFQDVLRGDLTRTLNWLLHQLARPVVAYPYTSGNPTLVHSQYDQTLTPDALNEIWLTDGGRLDSRLVLGVSGKTQIEQIRWPLALRGDEFAEARKNFERTRDSVISEIKEKGAVSHENETKLMQALNALFVALDNAFPKERFQNQEDAMAYLAARRSLETSLAASRRLITAHDANVLGGGLAFKGDSVAGLLQHMYQTGTEFAPPRAGGERVYKNLFENLRYMYMGIGLDDAPGNTERRPGSAAGKPGGN